MLALFAMETIYYFIDLALHLDRHLGDFIAAHGLWTYLVLALIVFCETGLVVTPFLPGDSLLFAAGALSVTTVLDPMLLGVILFSAAVLGDGVNYLIGRACGPTFIDRSNSRLIKKEHLVAAQKFYERHGGKAIVLSRFMPIVRTFAPFVAGMASMDRRLFSFYNVLGAFLWVTLFVGGGYFFGNIPIVKQNFTLVIMAIVAISVSPALIRYGQSLIRKRGRS